MIQHLHVKNGTVFMKYWDFMKIVEVLHVHS